MTTFQCPCGKTYRVDAKYADTSQQPMLALRQVEDAAYIIRDEVLVIVSKTVADYT